MVFTLNPSAKEFIPSTRPEVKPSFKAALLRPPPLPDSSSESQALPQGWESCSLFKKSSSPSPTSIAALPMKLSHPTPPLKFTSPDSAALSKHQDRWFEIAAGSRRRAQVEFPSSPIVSSGESSSPWHSVLHSSSLAKETAWTDLGSKVVDLQGYPSGGRSISGSCEEWVRALSSGEVAQVSAMVSRGWDLHARVENRGHFPIHAVVLSRSDEVLQLLMAHKVDVNVKDQSCRRTPLLYAVENNAFEVC